MPTSLNGLKAILTEKMSDDLKLGIFTPL